MQKRTLLILLTCALIVVGCVKDDVVPTAVVHVVETATITPTLTPIPPTSTPQPTKTETAVPTATGITILTRTLTPIPSRTPAPTATIQPQLIPPLSLTLIQPVPFIGNQYQLTTYNFQTFLNLMQICQSEQYDENCRGWNSKPFFNVMVADFARFYPEGNPEATQLITENPFPSTFEFWHPSTILRNMIHEGVIQYLNTNNIALSSSQDLRWPELVLHPIPINIDDDPELEWVLQLNFLRYRLQDWLPVEADAEGRYQIVSNEIEHQDYEYFTETTVAYDFTGDGQEELLLLTHDYISHGEFGVLVKIHSWNMNQFQLIGNASIYSSDENISYEIVDSNGNGRPEIHISQQRGSNYKCYWERIDTYEWNGTELHHSVVGDMAPDTAVCNIGRAITGRIGMDRIPVQERIALLEGALQELPLEIAPSADYLAYAKVQLAAMYAGQNEDGAAMQLLQSIMDYPTSGNPFVQLVEESLAASNSSPVAVCDYLYESAVGKSSRDSDPGINYFHQITQEVIYHFPPVTGRIVPELVCPIDDLVLNRLATSSLNGALSPTDALNAIGFPSSTILVANIDGDSDDEWLGYIDLRKPSIVLLDRVEDEWQAKVIFYNPYSTFQILEYDYLFQDFDNDQNTDLLLGLWVEEISPGPPIHNMNYLILIDSNEGGLELQNRPLYVEEPVDLSELTLEYFEDEVAAPSIWVELARQFGIEGNLRDYATSLTQRIIEQERPLTTLADLETLLAGLPDDEEVQPLRHQLMFLRGYHYELAGEAETAVSHYTTLIQQAPDSPWSWLAWARLEPTP